MNAIVGRGSVVIQPTGSEKSEKSSATLLVKHSTSYSVRWLTVDLQKKYF